MPVSLAARARKASGTEYPKGCEHPHVEEGQYHAQAVSDLYEEAQLDEETLIERWGLDPAKWSIVDGSLLVNRWQMGAKGQDPQWLYQYKARLRKRLSEDDLPLGLRLAPDFRVKVEGRPRKKPSVKLPSETWRVGIFYPDPQFGYWWDEGQQLHTIHDERCFDIRNQVMLDLRAEYGKISRTIGAGDTIDWAHFSRFVTSPKYVEQTLQNTIDRVGLEWQQLRAICCSDEEEIIILDGNHDNPRLTNALITKGLSSLVGLRRAGDDIAADPILSLQHMTRTADYGIKYVEPFPTATTGFNRSLGAAHGPAYSSKKGGTAQAILASARRSMLIGHIHREESMAYTFPTDKGPRTFYVNSPGTFCRIDLAVPSAKTNTTSRGTPAVGGGTEDWQQGFYVVTYDSEGSHFNIENVRIWSSNADEPSVAYWRGQRYVSNCDADGNPLEG